MALHNSGLRLPKPEDLIRLSSEGSHRAQEEIKHKVSGLPLDQLLEVLEKVLPKLERNKARDLVRLILGSRTAELLDKLAETRFRLTVIDCLWYLPYRQVVETLVTYMAHKDELVRLAAAEALKNHTPRLVVPILLNAFLKKKVLPARAFEVLQTMGYLAEDALIDLYLQAEPEMQAHIFEMLIALDNPKCNRYVGQALQSSVLLLQQQALEAVETFSFRETWPGILRGLLDPNWQVRAKCLQLLGKLGIKESRKCVDRLLEDPDPWVRECAGKCLQDLDGGIDRESNQQPD